MFLAAGSDGIYPLDPQEPPPETWELERAEKLLDAWHRGRRPSGPAPGLCPHDEAPCRSKRECLGRIVWWRRYIREIEGMQ